MTDRQRTSRLPVSPAPLSKSEAMSRIVEKLWQCVDIADAEDFSFVRHLTAVALLQATEERDDLEASEEDDRQIAARAKSPH